MHKTASTKKKQKTMLEALHKSRGIVTSACKSAGIPRSEFYYWKKNDPEFCKDVDDIEDIALDFVEGALHKQIEDGNPTSTIFYLKTKGKKRGYIEKQQVEHSGEIKGAPQIGFANTTQKDTTDS